MKYPSELGIFSPGASRQDEQIDRWKNPGRHYFDANPLTPDQIAALTLPAMARQEDLGSLALGAQILAVQLNWGTGNLDALGDEGVYRRSLPTEM